MKENEKTLHKALELGALGLELRCRQCLNRKNFTAARARATWKDERLTFPEIAATARCQCCGARDCNAAPLWPLRARGSSPPTEQPPKEWGR